VQLTNEPFVFRLHDPLANEPPAPPSLHEMEPEGGIGDELVSVTPAVNVMAFP
jgi:hypothetical protein